MDSYREDLERKRQGGVRAAPMRKRWEQSGILVLAIKGTAIGGCGGGGILINLAM